MQKEKSPKLVKMQFILFGLLLLVFFIWANRKCTRSQAAYQQEQQVTVQDSTLQDPTAATTPPPATPPGTVMDTLRGGQLQIIREKVTPLYVTIENLALRKGPDQRFEVIERLKLFEEVNYLQETSDSLYTIKLGETLTTTEPWVKVRTRKGRDGWVYGAGVDFFKRKLEGVD
ncbi:MAG: SH3 domain-containing protein [Saprospiraceae bacterium]